MRLLWGCVLRCLFEGIDVTLGINLAGERVWPVVFPSLVISAKPSFVGIPDESVQSFPEVCSACAVTCSMSHGDLVTGPANENGSSWEFIKSCHTCQ